MLTPNQQYEDLKNNWSIDEFKPIEGSNWLINKFQAIGKPTVAVERIVGELDIYHPISPYFDEFKGTTSIGNSLTSYDGNRPYLTTKLTGNWDQNTKLIVNKLKFYVEEFQSNGRAASHQKTMLVAKCEQACTIQGWTMTKYVVRKIAPKRFEASIHWKKVANGNEEFITTLWTWRD